MTVLVAGAGGFIGGHLVRRLLDDGHRVRAVDSKPFDDWLQIHPNAGNIVVDLARRTPCYEVVRGCDTVYDLAADMGGIGFIEHNKAECMLSVLIGTHLLLAARDWNVQRFFYSSSACVYAADKQAEALVRPLAEADAYPAMPEDGYGWEKLFTERMCRHFREDFGLETRVARYHNVYGPSCTWDGGREKAPAALCRKIAVAKATGSPVIDVWGDGEQTRSFVHVVDAIDGTLLLTQSDEPGPLNIGSSELVTINELVEIISGIAEFDVATRHHPTEPQGVRGRNSDNTLVIDRLGWEPSISLREGLVGTYRWVEAQVLRTLRPAAAAP